MLGWIVRIAIETGMRSSEIATLKLTQVDLDRRIVRLIETKNTLPRTVPLSKTAAENFRLALGNPARPDDTELIFSASLEGMVSVGRTTSIRCGVISRSD